MKIPQHKLKVAFCAAALLIAGSASAAIRSVTIDATTSIHARGAYTVATDGTIGNDNKPRTVGTPGSGVLTDAVFFFKLPTLAADESFNTASLNFEISSKDGTAPNVNLKALRVTSGYDITASDFQAGGTMLQSNFINATDDAVDKSTGTNLASLNNYITNNWADAQYLVVSLQAAANPGGTANRWLVAVSGGETELTINIVPEPETYALIFGGLSLGFVMLRRRIKG